MTVEKSYLGPRDDAPFLGTKAHGEHNLKFRPHLHASSLVSFESAMSLEIFERNGWTWNKNLHAFFKRADLDQEHNLQAILTLVHPAKSGSILASR